MIPPVPEVTVRIDKATANRRTRQYELHISGVIDFKNWDKRRQLPKKRGE
jgi:hypothetical protein